MRILKDKEHFKCLFTGRYMKNYLNGRIIVPIYMAVGGMPQAVVAYINNSNFEKIDQVKRQIIKLYEDDFKKIDPSGKISAIYHNVPAQLAKGNKRFNITSALGGKKTSKKADLLYDLIDSKTVLPCYHSTSPSASLSDTKDLDSYKLYLADTGLFVSLLFIDRKSTENEVYAKLLSDKLPANLGYLYENMIAQMIAAKDRELYYYTWEKENSSHYYEIDFLTTNKNKLNVFEVKSSGTGNHESLNVFCKKFSKHIANAYLISQKDVANEDSIMKKPVYMVPFLI